MKAWIPLLAVAAAAAFLVHRSYDRDLSAARARIASGSTIVATKCGAIEYAETGQGPAVLLVHGAGGGWNQGWTMWPRSLRGAAIA